jgi:hypothetical protein
MNLQISVNLQISDLYTIQLIHDMARINHNLYSKIVTIRDQTKPFTFDFESLIKEPYEDYVRTSD